MTPSPFLFSLLIQSFAFFRAADDWTFPIHFALAKTGMRPGELVHVMIEEVDLDRGWLHVRGKPFLAWRIKSGRDRAIPLVDELASVLRRVIGNRQAGLVFVRPKFCRVERPTAASLNELQAIFQQRLDGESSTVGRPLNRAEQARIARGVWSDAGMVKVDAIRTSFIHAMKTIGHPEATCPKSWRHSFATLLQDASVDPLIRQITLGHQPSSASNAALGMTTVYTHTRPETHRAEIIRALQLWPHSLTVARMWSQGGT